MMSNYFRQWWAAGYKDIIPVVPPGAKLSENSYIRKNSSAGKAPGVKYESGYWGGMPGWREHVTTEADVEAWHTMGASVGLRRGDAFVLDIDAYDEATANQIEQDAIEQLGPAPCRVGQWPKRALLYRADGPIPGVKLIFSGKDQKPNQIETPAQVVVYGKHSSGRHYEWLRKPEALDNLSPVSAAKLNAFLEGQRAKLPAAHRSDTLGNADREKIDQRRLQGNPDLVAEAVRRLPNTREAFPTYDDMIRVGNAISAALPGDRLLANELWHEWCEKWEGGDYDHDLTERRWSTIKPPHAFGAPYLFELADKLAPLEGGKTYQALSFFEEIPDEEENPFAQIELNASKEKDTYRLLTIDEIMNRPLPTWLIDRHVPDKAVGFIYSEPGVGKSFLALDMALSVAHGLENWHGDKLKQQPDAAVVYIASEGSFDFGTRVKAWHKARGLNQNQAKSFYIIEQTINFMNADDVERLLRTLRGVAPARPVLVVVDTVSRALPGADENLQKDMTRFVQACDAVRDAFSCAVLGIHHAGKSGDMRGSTVLLGAGDFVFRLTRKKGATIGHLTCEKQKAAPDGWEEPYRFDVVGVGEGESSLVPVRMEGSIGPSVELTPDVSATVLSAMSTAWDEGRPWSKAPQSKDRYAIRHMVSDFGFDAEKAEETLAMWEQTGLIAMELRSAKHRVTGFKVAATSGQPVRSEGIFD